jgi:hypothetical protein
LRELLARATGGQPLVAVIGGEAGVSKTRLVVHLAAAIAALILMFHPAANAYLRATTRAPTRRGTQQGRGGEADQ